MNEKKYSPAPWVHTGNKIYTGFLPFENEIATVKCGPNRPECMESARLIAAAPNLLDVLAHLVRLARDPDYSEREADDVLDRADALLTRLGVQL